MLLEKTASPLGCSPVTKDTCRLHLARARADIDKPDNLGASLLPKASSIGHAEVAQFVCRARADIDNPVTDRATPLLMASQHGYADVAQFLYAATADINT